MLNENEGMLYILEPKSRDYYNTSYSIYTYYVYIYKIGKMLYISY